MTRDFEALTKCPSCGNVGYHWMREPKWPPIPESVEEIGISDFSGEIVSTTVEKTYPAGTEQEDIDWNTSNCNVVRTCKQCGESWGED